MITVLLTARRSLLANNVGSSGASRTNCRYRTRTVVGRPRRSRHRLPFGVGIDCRQANSPIVRLAQEGPRRRVDLSASLLGASLSTPRRLPGAPLLGAADAGFLQGYVD